MLWKSNFLWFCIGALSVLVAFALLPLRDALFSFSSATTRITGSAPEQQASVSQPQTPASTASGSPTSAASPTPAAREATPRPSQSPAPLAVGRNFLRADGSRLVDGSGREVQITGVNWFGMETGTFAPHGIWARRWQDMLDLVVNLGFNTIRLPYSNDILNPNSKPNGIDFYQNPDLQGLSPLEILDKIVQGAGERGLKIILDRHRPDQNGQSDLWYTDKVGEEKWIDDWKQLARRYRGNATVIGADLHNEPHGAATWGDGNPRTDWRLAAGKAGNAILSVNPDWLIIVEGIDTYKGDGYWWGGNLKGVAELPVRLAIPNKLVYSAHDYGPGVHGQSWFSDATFPKNLPGIWDPRWAFIQKQGIAPVLMGEFGGRSVGIDTEGVWQRSLMKFLKERGIHYTYWTLNPNSGDTGGILLDDWKTVDRAKHAVLAEYQAPLIDGKAPPY